MDIPETLQPRRPHPGQIAVGLIVVSMGVFLLADRYFDRDIPLMRSWWPLVPILLGAVRVASARSAADGQLRSGVWLILVGVWAMVSDWHLFGLSYQTSWPLLVIASGLMIVWRALEHGGRVPLRREP